MDLNKIYKNIEDKNAVCIAGAGAGKTHLYINYLQYLIKNKGINKNRILCITYTNNATNEIRERLEKIGIDTSGMTICTFHSFAKRFLSKYVPKLVNGFKLVPQWWEYKTMYNISEKPSRHNSYGIGLTGINVADLYSFIKSQKNDGIAPYDNTISINDISENVLKTHSNIPKEKLIKAYKSYEDVKRGEFLIDYDDYLLYFYKSLKSSITFRNLTKDSFDYIMVDEFQDTSTIMLKILKLIIDKNLFVVGDFRQSIYSFMNANVNNILNFDEYIDDSVTVELTNNHRSDKKIVQLSNQIINSSVLKSYKKYDSLVPISKNDGLVEFQMYSCHKKELNGIANEINHRVNIEKSKQCKDIAIIARKNSDLAEIESALYDMGIPYTVNEKASFYQKMDIVNILNYLRIIDNPFDDHAVRFVCNTPHRYVSRKKIIELSNNTSSSKFSLFNTMKNCGNKNIEKYYNTLENIIAFSKKNSNVGKIIRHILKETRYYDFLENNSKSPEICEDKKQSLDKLCEIASESISVSSFLNKIEILETYKKKSLKDNSVTLTTAHSAKGLEWDICYVINSIDGSFPSSKSINFEEERRLFYVAVSRAKNELNITWNISKENNPSPYITELLGENKIKEMNISLFKGNDKVSHMY